MKFIYAIIFIFVQQIVAQTIPYPVYYADVFHEQNNIILHFKWRTDYPNYNKAILTNTKGEVLDNVKFPYNTFNIFDFHKNEETLFITTIDKIGTKSELLKIDLHNNYSDIIPISPMQQIVVQKGNSVSKSKFIKSNTKEEFIIKGVNYCGIKLGDHDLFEPSFHPSKSLLNLAKKHNIDLNNFLINDSIVFYDSYHTESMLRKIKSNGFNLVRVFIKTGERASQITNIRGISGDNKTVRISSAYMDNFIDFLTLATKYGIYVMPTFTENEMLDNNYFKKISGGVTKQEILFSEKGIKAKQLYIELFLKYIKTKNPELINTLFALTMQNEFVFHSYEEPFSQVTGAYTFIDGSKYEMSSDKERRALANKAIQNYYSKMKFTMNKYAPGLLIGEGTFAMGAVGKSYKNSKGIRKIEGNEDERFPMTAVELLNTEIDFLDFHIYRWGKSGNGQDVFNYFVNNMKLSTPKGKKLMKNKPVIMGEFGSFKEDEATLDEGIKFVKELKQSALKFGFKGTCYWTMDTFEQARLWNLMWDNGKMLKQL